MKLVFRIVTLCVLVSFSTLSVGAVAQSRIQAVSDRADEAFAELDERTAEVADDGIVLPTQDNMIVEKGGVAVISPVTVNVDVLPAPPVPVYKQAWLWVVVTAVVAGIVVGGVCGAGHCDADRTVSSR